MEKCKDLMSVDVKCCLPGDTARRAAEVMWHENVGAVPVIEDEKSRRLIGIVTDRDLAVSVVREGRDPDAVHVKDVMTENPVSVDPDDDISEVVTVMEDYQVRRVPVVDTSKSVIGIIAQADIALRSGDDKLTGEVVEEISRGD